MSVFTEGQPVWDSSTIEEEKIGRFFFSDMDPNARWEWHLNGLGKKKGMEIVKSKGVNLNSVPIEIYSIEDNLFPTHKIYSTAQSKSNGIYLEIVTPDDNHKSRLPKMIFHRLGENLNRQYIDSLTNG